MKDVYNMNKKGISVVSITVSVVVLLILISTISVSITYSISNAEKLTFASEIYNIQNIVSEYIQKENIFPATTETIQVEPTDLEQFEGENIIDGKLLLYVLDLSELDIVNTKYGNKEIGKTAGEKAKDVYAVSQDTGKVYYITGFKDKEKTYYTLTHDLLNMIGKKQALLIGEKTILFIPNKLGWTNEAVTVKVIVPTDYTVTKLSIDNVNITYSQETKNGLINYNINSNQNIENYKVTIQYTKNGVPGEVSYSTKIDTVAPTITRDTSIANTEKYINGLKATDDESGIKYFKYANGTIKESSVKKYMEAYGEKVKKGSIKISKEPKNTLYAEDKAGNITMLYIDKNGKFIEPIDPPTLAPNYTWYSSSTSRANITKIKLVGKYTPTGNETESWPAAVDKDGDKKNDSDIMCYVDGTELIIAGNGAEEIKMNADSSYVFSGSKKDNFTNITSITGLDILDTSVVTNMSYMFYRCNQLTALDLSNWNTANVTDMSLMFDSCNNLAVLDISEFDTSNVTNMRNMFAHCEKLASLDVSSFKTSNVTTMRNMFSNCSSLISLDLTGFNTVNVTEMSQMFYNCFLLTSLDLSGFDTSNVTTMSEMFTECTSLTTLDVSNFNTSNVTTMWKMFYNCKKLTSLDVSNFDTSKVTNMDSMFTQCSNLTELYVNNFDTSNVTTMYYMFSACSRLTTLDLSNWNTSNVTTIIGMFSSCGKLTTLDVSSFYLPKATTLAYMFRDCNKLTTLDLSNFKPARARSILSMFSGCTSLQTINLSNFNTYSLENMESAFSNCKNLTELDLRSFNTSNVIDMERTFYNCSNLITLNISNFNTSKVTDMRYTFYECNNLKFLDVSKFNTSNVTTMSSMFDGCTNLTELDLTNWNTSNVTTMSSMFNSCSNLAAIYVSDEFVTTSVTSHNYMFRDCTRLKGGNGTAYNSSYTDKTYARIDASGTPGYFTANMQKLAIPVLTISNNVLTISSVAGASTYAIYIDGVNVATITTNTYDLSSVDYGTHTIGVVAKASGKEDSAMATTSFTKVEDTVGPRLTVTNPTGTSSSPTTTTAGYITVTGRAIDDESGVASVTVNGSNVAVNENGGWETTVSLVKGLNTITVVARDNRNNTSTIIRYVSVYEETTPDSEFSLSGVWVFEEEPDLSLAIEQTVNFRSCDIEYTGFSIEFDDEDRYLNYIEYGAPDPKLEFYVTPHGSIYSWSNDNYQVVDFGAVPQEVSPAFYKWFTANAHKY